MASVEMQVIDNGVNFLKCNDLDVVYVLGIAEKCSKAYCSRLKNANNRFLVESSSIIDCARIGQVNMKLGERMLEEEAKKTEQIAPDNKRIKVMAVETAKQENLERVNQSFPVMNEQVLTNAMNKTTNIQFQPAQNTLTLRRAA